MNMFGLLVAHRATLLVKASLLLKILGISRKRDIKDNFVQGKIQPM